MVYKIGSGMGGYSLKADSFVQRVQSMQEQLELLCQSNNGSIQLEPDLSPSFYKNIGIVSEELQVALEELQQQNIELEATRTALEIERQRYQELFEFAPHSYLVTDLAGIIQEANRAAAKLLNVSPQSLIGKPLLLFIAEEERKTFYTQLTQLQRSEQTQEWLLRICPRQGEPLPTAIAASVMRDLQNKPVGLRLSVVRASGNGWQAAALDKNGSAPIPDLPKQVYLKGETIPIYPQSIWLVCRGIVKLSTMSETGEEVLLGLAGPSMPFGAELTSLGTYQATALSEVELTYFFLQDVAANPDLAQKILPSMSQRLQHTEALLAVFGQRRAKDRLHYLLQFLKQQFGQPMPQGIRLNIRLTHQELAAACSTTRVTITRMLGKLQEEGKIFIDYKNHIVLIEKDL